jgi:hypothetical protein
MSPRAALVLRHLERGDQLALYGASVIRLRRAGLRIPRWVVAELLRSGLITEPGRPLFEPGSGLLTMRSSDPKDTP